MANPVLRYFVMKQIEPHQNRTRIIKHVFPWQLIQSNFTHTEATMKHAVEIRCQACYQLPQLYIEKELKTVFAIEITTVYCCI